MGENLKRDTSEFEGANGWQRVSLWPDVNLSLGAYEDGQPLNLSRAVEARYDPHHIGPADTVVFTVIDSGDLRLPPGTILYGLLPNPEALVERHGDLQTGVREIVQQKYGDHLPWENNGKGGVLK